MQHKNVRISYKSLFCMALFVLLISRILVLTENYAWPIDPVLLEIVYLIFVAFVVVAANKGSLRIQRGKYLYVLAVLMIHTVLWGTIFTDARFKDLITSHFKSQIMFVTVLCITVWAVQQLNAATEFLKCSYCALSTVLLVQLVRNFSEVDLSNLTNIMSATDRTRANFGFGHYNTLGAACVCVILLREIIKKQNRSIVMKCIDLLILIMALCMLLCSASRSALTSLVLYYIFYHGAGMDKWPLSKRVKLCIKLVGALFVGILFLWALLEMDAGSLLVAAQRSHIFTKSIPMFIKTGRTWLGLGYASTVAYASGQTPYTTYWLDNAYAYFLITTGIAGLALLLSVLGIMGRELYKRAKTQYGLEVLSTFAVYVYISFFEAILFNSGGIVNYVYVPWFLICMAGNCEKLNGTNKPRILIRARMEIISALNCKIHRG